MTWTPPSFKNDGSALRSALPPEGWREAMLEISARHSLPTDALAPFSTGSDIVWGEHKHVIKMTRPRWAKELATERESLERCGGRLDVAIPEVIATGTLGGWPYLIMTRLEDPSVGEVWPTLDARARRALAHAIGRCAAALHALPCEDTDWSEFLDARRAGVVEHQRRRGVEEVWLAQLEPFLERVARPARPLVFLHTELLTEHILVREVDGEWQPSGLIDFADARVGHPEYEFAALIEFIFKGEAGCLGACLRGYGWGPDALEGAPERLVAWGLLHQFGDLGRALRAAGPLEATTLEALARAVYDVSQNP